MENWQKIQAIFLLDNTKIIALDLIGKLTLQHSSDLPSSSRAEEQQQQRHQIRLYSNYHKYHYDMKLMSLGNSSRGIEG